MATENLGESNLGVRSGGRRVLMVAVLIRTGWRPLSSLGYWEEQIPEGVGGEG